MIRLLPLSGMFVLTMAHAFLSCHGQNETSQPKDNIPQTTPANLPGVKPIIEDPTFIKARDTVSTYGPHSITRNVLQDRNGTIWIATWEGIVRYDGAVFTNVTLKEGLRHFHIFSMLEDNAGNLWFGTIGGGLYRYDGTTFTLFTTADGLVRNSIMCILQDNSGNIWFGTDQGVSRYDGHAFTNFTTQDGLRHNFVSTIAQDKTGKLWFGTNGGVSCYDGSHFAGFTNKEGISLLNVRSIIADKSNNIWISSQDELYRYDGNALVNVTKHFTGCIFEDKTGNLWLSEGNSKEMVLTQYDGNSFTKITSDRQVFGITEDRAGNIWFGTADGVCRYDGKSITRFTESVRKQNQR